MYIPKEFEVTDRSRLHRIIRDNNFGILVSVVDGAPTATHLPFMIDPDRGENGTLLAHIARANPHWQSFGDGDVLVVFNGPHGYISPSWYEPGKAVPTWNYIAVHAYGRPVLVENAPVGHLRQLVDTHEAGFGQPWSLDGQEERFIDGLSKGVVAFEIPISRLEGKAKLNQNRSTASQARVVHALECSPDPANHALARSMRDVLGDLPALD